MLLRVSSEVDQPRQAEIEDLDDPGIRDEDVRRLDVAMDDAVRVRELQPFADLDRDLDAPAQAHALRRRHAREQILPLRGIPSPDTADLRARRGRES